MTARPTDWPVCAYCGRSAAEETVRGRNAAGKRTYTRTGKPTRWHYGFTLNDDRTVTAKFCRLQCAEKFAAACYAAGFRMQDAKSKAVTP